jgi:hypothetical protein
MFSTLKLIAAAGLISVSTAQAQTAERALLSAGPSTAMAQRFSTGSTWLGEAQGFGVDGERALLGRVGNAAEATDHTDVPDTSIDGTRALLGRPISARITSAERSTFVAALRGSAAGEASGEAEFGSVSADRASSPFVLSLGARGDQSAVLFTRPSGTPLGVGKYRISNHADGADEIRALVMTGSATKPTGVFHGRSGWLVVTEASDNRLTGRFHFDGVGFLAAEPELEDRPMIATGSFSAIAVQ